MRIVILAALVFLVGGCSAAAPVEPTPVSLPASTMTPEDVYFERMGLLYESADGLVSRLIDKLESPDLDSPVWTRDVAVLAADIGELPSRAASIGASVSMSDAYAADGESMADYADLGRSVEIGLQLYQDGQADDALVLMRVVHQALSELHYWNNYDVPDFSERYDHLDDFAYEDRYEMLDRP